MTLPQTPQCVHAISHGSHLAGSWLQCSEMTFKKEHCSPFPPNPGEIEKCDERWYYLLYYTLAMPSPPSNHCFGIHICCSPFTDNIAPPFLTGKLHHLQLTLLSVPTISKLAKEHLENMHAKSGLYKYLYQIKSIINQKVKHKPLECEWYNLFRYLTTFPGSPRNLISWLNRGRPSMGYVSYINWK